MSTAKITEDRYGYGNRVVRVNGRDHHLPRIESVDQVDTYSFRVTHRNKQQFLVWGGKKSGGHSNQWFVDGWPNGGSIKCTSLVDALKMLDGM